VLLELQWSVHSWDEFVLKIEFYALNLSCIMLTDVKVFVQWGCVSDIPLAGMDSVKYPDI
jgi:hypothetical protein